MRPVTIFLLFNCKRPAQKTYQERTTTGSDAAETYAITVGYLDADLLDAQDDYDEAVKKLSEFNTYIPIFYSCKK